MEHLGFAQAVELIKAFGLPGLVLLLWFLSDKAREKDLKAYREDSMTILAAYKDDMVTMRQMYESNVVLVKQYADLCGNLREIVTLNAGEMKSMNHNIENNIFCPLQRVKKAAGVPE